MQTLFRLLSTFSLVVILVLPSSAGAYALIDFNALSAAGDVGVGSVSVPQDDSVENVQIISEQKGHLLAFLPVTVPVRVTAWARGTLDIHYP